MMESHPPETLVWSSQFAVVPVPTTAKPPPGDKIILPPSALEQLLAAAPMQTTDDAGRRQQYTSSYDPLNPYTHSAEIQARAAHQDRSPQLPHPLTFRLVNPDNGHVVYAGIREFSANEGEIILSEFLVASLSGRLMGSLEASARTHDSPDQATQSVDLSRVTVHAATLPLGQYVKLRPLEAGYDVDDWKSLLERHLRSNFTTLTNREILVIPGVRANGSHKTDLKFLVDGFKPAGDGICVVDTDLEVDIEALNEQQARDTLKQNAERHARAQYTSQSSSSGGELGFMEQKSGQIRRGDRIDFDIPSWDRSQGLTIELDGLEHGSEVDLLASIFSPHQRSRPRRDEHMFADFSDSSRKVININATNVELELAEAIWVSIDAQSTSDALTDSASPIFVRAFTIKVSPSTSNASDGKLSSTLADTSHDPSEVQCKNCLQWIPASSLMLHENFCLRNNILCPKGCGKVFQKRSEKWQNHWHCDHDDSYGDNSYSHEKHDSIHHEPQTCDGCARVVPSLLTLAQHKTTVCPEKLILCRFCHLEVPQEGDPDSPDPHTILTGLTAHEVADGGRTTNCHLCNNIVRLRDMDAHLKHHNLERLRRLQPRMCRNLLCGRTLDGANKTGNTRSASSNGAADNALGICGSCFGPLYVSVHDPEGTALRRRVERRYLTQLLTGCGKSWCYNPFCKSGRTNLDGAASQLSTKDALPSIRPFIDGLKSQATPLHFCVDEASQTRRSTAEMISQDPGLTGKGGFSLEWCIAALEAENGDLTAARSWLSNFAPQRKEKT